MAQQQLFADEYKVNLDVFEGPLDLLLYLIRREELDIYDIPIEHITAEYMKFINEAREMNLDIAGEFIVMAASFRAGGYGYGHAKKALLAAYRRMFDPFKARRDELEKDPDALEDILREGAKKARAAAAPVMEKVRRAVGL